MADISAPPAAKSRRSPLAATALSLIWVYQRYISPRKGFSCAHRVLHGGPGCSGYAKHAIQDHGLFAAVPLVRQRFRDCKTAYETIQERKAEEHKRKRKEKRRKKDDEDDTSCCDLPELGCEGAECCASKPRACVHLGRSRGGGKSDCADCDCGPVDCMPCDGI